MKKLAFALTALILASSATAAQASPKFLGIFWWPSHWTNQDFVPNYDNGTDPHNSQWMGTNWTPADWIKAEGGDGTKLVQKWMTAGIIVGSYKDMSGIPYLEIGPNFYHLSGLDKRKVTETLDVIYQVTANKPGMYFIKDAATQKVIGTFSKEGLNLE
ncbi:MAG: hypothetical protein A3J37_05345 [Alphaproteobacteria bacterium RIFCSPHIGHO2_12_FULL_45_9]|nr:MAG: hypothetical protein A3B66_10645 [Alphaproteobacteria bacterium RIFCSPHIGHO2_02_FULL_46_13]OFW99350.1 MAG: hypothetical protein A3J37_05345 [Alphaproteobacteria bacterium RIFCSPHIGHO2_12_FULL_45_9]